MDPPPDDPADAALTVAWRGRFGNAELNALHAECFGHAPTDDDWWSRVNRLSLGWVCMRDAEALVGFVNVAWDGGDHAFLIDTMVAAALRRSGLATRLVRAAVDGARAGGCEWLHVDFAPDLAPFYLDACGFAPTPAGLIRLG